MYRFFPKVALLDYVSKESSASTTINDPTFQVAVQRATIVCNMLQQVQLLEAVTWPKTYDKSGRLGSRSTPYSWVKAP